MSLKGIFCQDRAISLLQRAFASDKVPHAYIFAGLEGVGKFRTASEWAKLLLCKKPAIGNDFADSCGSCQSCQAFEAGSHPDFDHIYKELVEFTRDGKGRTTPVDLPIDVIREFLIEKATTKPTLSRRKVFVVSEAERLNAASQNCMLKVLEEPPEFCTIILLCTRLERLLPTTKSRCQIIRFGAIEEDRVVEKLKEMGIEQRKARYFARLSQGSLGTACRWAQLELAGADLYQTKRKLVDSIAGYKLADALELAEQFVGETKRIAAVWAELDKATSMKDINRRTQKTLIQIVISALYDAMKANAVPAKDAINFDQKEAIINLAGRFDVEQAADRITGCYSALRWVEASVNEKLIFEQLLLNLAGSDIINAK